MGLRIVVAPNEDGLGSSAWAVRLVKALARAGGETIQKIYVAVASDRLAAFHAGKYPGLPVEVVQLADVCHPVRLIKMQGGVDIPATLEQSVLTYQESREEYRRAATAAEILSDADLLIDFAVPQLLRAAREEAGADAAEAARPLCVTVSDHAWSDTLGRLAEAAGLLDQRVSLALEDMRADEALADLVFTFPEPISPPQTMRYWRDRLGLTVERLPGVLGGPEVAQEWAGGEPRAAIRRMLGLVDGLPVLHLTGGGTGVWEGLLSRLLDDYRSRPPLYHVVVFSPSERARRGACLAWSGGIETGREPGAPRVIHLGDVTGETHHVLFAAFDLVCTRAGGGTVNDALAFGVPLVLVEEIGHAQVEAIRERCVAMGLARGVTLEEFRRLGRAVLEDERGELRRLPCPPVQIGRHAEGTLAGRLLSLARKMA